MKPRLLFVDDDEAVRESLALVLEASGYEVVVAKDGSEGLALFQSAGPFFAVVTDYSMPVMNGVDLCVAIRKINPAQRIVLITGSNGVCKLLEVHNCKDIPVLQKPCGKRELMEILERYGKQSSAANPD